MLTREGKKSIIIHSILFVIWLGLLIFASFKDLEFSKAVSNSESFLGALFAVLAEWPAYLITPVATIILFYNVDNMTKVRGKNITLKVVFAILHFGGWFLFFNGSEKLYENMPHETLFAVVYALMAGIACLYFAKFVDRDFMRKLCKWAVFALIVLVVSRVVVTGIKLVWSRARFRDMLAHNNAFEMFTPWYHPNGFRKVDGYKLTSFPSGHVTSATNLFVIVVLADVLPSLKKAKTGMYIFCGLFVAFTMFYRIVFNAHFLSDTLIALLISYLTFYLTKLFFFKKGYEYFKKDEAVTQGEDAVEDNEVASAESV